MKTTVEISDNLLEEARQAAAANGQTFRQLLEISLRIQLDSRKAERRGFKLKNASFGGAGLAAGMTWSNIRDGIYEGRGE